VSAKSGEFYNIETFGQLDNTQVDFSGFDSLFDLSVFDDKISPPTEAQLNAWSNNFDATDATVAREDYVGFQKPESQYESQHGYQPEPCYEHQTESRQEVISISDDGKFHSYTF
jgi:hypothetical protein